MTQRNIAEIIDKIVEQIPDHYMYFDLREGLKKIKRDSVYKAPEAMGDCWHRIACLLQEYLGDPKTHDWKQRIANIFSGRE